MASPQLKKTAVTAPPRRLINSGVVPTTKVRLKGTNGQVINPKAPTPALKTKKKDEPTPAEDIATNESAEASSAEAAAAAAQAEAEAKAAEEAAQKQAEEEAQRRAEEEAQRRAEEEARKQAEEEAAAQAQYEKEMEEYNRQMEEYNRQMEEYNKKLEEQARIEAEEAAAQAAEAAAAESAHLLEDLENAPAPAPAEPVTEPPPVPEVEISEQEVVTAPDDLPVPPVPVTPHPAPAAEEAPQEQPQAKPALKKKGARKLGAAAPDQAAPEELPEGMQNVDAHMLAQLQSEAERRPIYKSPIFFICVGALVLFVGICGYFVMEASAERERMIAQNEKTMKILRRAREINEQEIESLKDAKAKGVNISCSLEEAEFLMNVVVNPAMRDEKGKPMFGNKPEGVAQLACLLLGIASEADANICKMVLSRLEKEAPKIKPALYRWLVQRLAVADIKKINTKLRKLAENVDKLDAPNFNKRSEILSYIWETIGLRVTEKDIPVIIKKLKQPDLDNRLGSVLINCLSNIVRMERNAKKKMELGDKIFDAIPEKMRPGAADVLGASCSPKALAYFKERAADAKNWRTDRLFFANYGSDDILPFLETLRMKTGGIKNNEAMVQSMIVGLFQQNRDRTLDQARRFISLIPSFDKVDSDISDWPEIMEKTEEGAAAFVGTDHPQYAKLMERRKELEECRKQKISLITQLSNMFDYAWVRSYLEKFSREPDDLLAHEARVALEKVEKNRLEDEKLHSKYEARDKE